ncbi:putative reverse transcriptase zinc-binding domain-containing protein [Helianthus annuus]|nr:putative reverse transcriptase zinc-binding domain-containing protein [Helianthus annuus]KAJ0662650.1 putative reverse transcriptase zinc-binding domain-containing protein [Helianthus annuus]
MERNPTSVGLNNRNIQVESTLCPLCELGMETADHLFSSCAVAAMVWQSISNWCSPPFLVFFSIRDVVKWHNHNRLGAREKEVMQGIVIIACWRIWKARNDKVYNGKDCKIEEIIGDIKALGFLWYAHRSKFKFTEWLKWCKFSFVWLRFGADFSVVSVRCCCVLVWVVYKIRLSKKKKAS